MSSTLIPGRIAIGGSRSISSLNVGAVRTVTRALLDAGYRIRVGCSMGVDAAVIASVPPSVIGQCHVSAVCGPVSRVSTKTVHSYSAPGSWPGTALDELYRHAQAGGQVQWWAGGGEMLPLSVRLAARTRAMVAGASAGCVVFFDRPGSKGSALCARTAAARGLPVWACPLGFPGFNLPSLGAGSWSRFNLASPMVGMFIWEPWAHSRR